MTALKTNKLLKKVCREFDALPQRPSGRRAPAPDSLWEQVAVLAQHFRINELAEQLERSPSVISKGIRRTKAKSGHPLKKYQKKHTFVKVEVPSDTVVHNTAKDKTILELSTKSGMTIRVFE